MSKRALWLVLLATFLARTSLGEDKNYVFSYLNHAMTANAGGQRSHGLFLSDGDQYEAGFFVNEYLLAGERPLFGLLASKRFALFPELGEPYKNFLQVGAGFASTGGIFHFGVVFNPFWLIRIDVSTHFYILRNRVVIWNYPFWFGFSLPLS